MARGLSTANIFLKSKFISDDRREKVLVLAMAYFNYHDVNKTLISLSKQDKVEFIDVILLENPSKYSVQMKKVAEHPIVQRHYIADENVEGLIMQEFVRQNQDFVFKYKYIAMTESDVVLDYNSISESLHLIRIIKDVGVVSVNLRLDNLQIPPLPPEAVNWVPPAIEHEIFLEGPTGFQMIIFPRDNLKLFLNALVHNELGNGIALGNGPYHGISDSNLAQFLIDRKLIWARTKNSSLLHIGWEHYKDPTDEYWMHKNDLLDKGMIRREKNVTMVKFTRDK